MPRYIPGQRWISDTEPELGLGTLLDVQDRLVTILFEAAAETRCYALDNAPLSRVIFAVGDSIENREGGRLTVAAVLDNDGLLSYQGLDDRQQPVSFGEGELNSCIQFSHPQDRLFAGQIDPDAWFILRQLTLEHWRVLERSPVRGLLGARAALLEHQFYIANEVGQRHAPRVLLADEVGLGKTIEAGLILHQQLTTHRAKRVLILVPGPLVNQWLVELLRRFNLHFSIFDEQRCRAAEGTTSDANPFQAEQWVLCGLDLFTEHPVRRAQVIAGDWDLVLVDEAHHLQWAPEQASPEYRMVEALARCSPGLLLITATPEQLGRTGHFARLRLLDPDRFYDLAAFDDEVSGYRRTAELVEALLTQAQPPPASMAQWLDTFEDGDCRQLLEQICASRNQEDVQQARERLVSRLLDRHGTGRVMFRNTRTTVKGFPGRVLRATPLPLPEDYKQSLALPHGGGKSTGQWLSPELRYQGGRAWWRIDPRVPWLSHTLTELAKEKVLVICARSDTATGLAKALRTLYGQQAALFHEAMTIMERDRAAAWFADPYEGAQLLICSEIGSEGRNFQFAHHLVLFDLPLDPDLLEQRIGRLDRIGQQNEIHIHVPYLLGSPQERLFRWHHEALDAFTHTCPAGQTLYQQFEHPLLKALVERPESLDSLITSARQRLQELDEALRKGRDHLLELGSCRPEAAQRLVEELRGHDQNPALPTYARQLFDSFGIELEELSDNSFSLKPGQHSLTDGFPNLPSDGITFTYDRDTALTHENRQFLTWEHPLISDAMEMVMQGELGNTSAVTVRHPDFIGGQLLLECLFVLEVVAPRTLQAGRFLPHSLIPVLLDESGNDLSPQLKRSHIDDHRLTLERSAGVQIIQRRQPLLRKLLTRSKALAERRLPGHIKLATEAMMRDYTEEIQRLQALRKVNPNVRGEEIQALQQQGLDLHRHLSKASLRLDAIRLILTL